MNKTTIKFILLLVLLLVSFVGGISVQRHWHKEDVLSEQVDTVWIEKEVYVKDPIPVEVSSAAPSTPPVMIKKEDLQTTPDSSTVSIHPSTTTYRDTLPSGASYDIAITGVGTKLEHIQIKWPETYTTRTVTKEYKGWELSAVGKGMATSFERHDMTYMVGMEFGYTAGAFSIGIGPGVVWQNEPGSVSPKANLCITGTVRLRLLKLRSR